MSFLRTRWEPSRRGRWGLSVDQLPTVVESIIIAPSDPSMVVIRFADESSLRASPIYLRNQAEAEALFDEHELRVRINALDVRAMLAAIGFDVSEWSLDDPPDRWWGHANIQ